jgi:putative FmdB family regulatory protein
MPIYEYQCGACGHRLETMQKMSEDPLVDCPACGRPALRKLISAAGFQLKGSGWYATDFKDSGKKKPGDGGKTQSSKDAAPEAKSSGSDTANGDASQKSKTSSS